MDSEVIYIEDSPPITPIKNLPPTPKRTSLIPTTENLLRKINFSINNNNYENTYEAINLTKHTRTNERNTENVLKQIITNTDSLSTQMTNLPCYSSNYYGLKSQNMEGGTICYPIVDGNTSITPIAYPLTTMASDSAVLPPVKYDNLSFKQSYTARFYSHEEYTNMLPEFVDINNFMDYSYFKENMATDLQNKQTENLLSKRYKTSVPQNLNRNRIEAKMSVIDLSIDTTKDALKTEKSDDEDCIFVGAYARESTRNQSLEPPVKTPELPENSGSPEESSQEDDKGKRKRKTTVTVPRRNPKRQVQIEKDYLKLLDNVMNESKKDVKPKKVKRLSKGNSPGADKKTGAANPNKRSPRQTNCGAVYCPPSPLSTYHIKKWPVSGMHERPEYNVLTGKLEPFDSIIRNISEAFNEQQGKTKTENEKSSETNDKELWLLCHEMLHHVFAYGATVKQLKDNENGEEHDKDLFLNDLNVKDVLIKPLNLSKKKRKTSPSKKTDSDLTDVKTLMENSLLLYCLTNDVDRKDLSKYIDSLVPDEIIEWSNKTFNLID